MSRDLSWALARAGRTWATALLVLLGLVAIVAFGPTLEMSYTPVLADQSVSVLNREGDRVTFEMRVRKVRNCRLQEVGWVVRAGERATWITVYREDGTPVGANASYETGWLWLGPFYADLPLLYRDPDMLYGVLYYDCHSGWLTRQILGPVTL